MRRGIALFLGCCIMAAAVAVFARATMPFFLLSPTTATSVPDVLTVEGASDAVSGDFLLTTVSIRPTTSARQTYEKFDHLLPWVEHDFEEVQPIQEVLPPDTHDQNRFFEAQREVFDESVQVAAAVGLRLAGRDDIAVSGDGAEVVGVVPGGPAEGELRPGDVIVAVDSEEVELASRLAARTGDASVGERLELTVVRGDEEVTVPVTIGRIPGPETDRPGIGIYVRTRNQQIQLPDDVDVENTSSIGGPSAGLLLALTIYDMFDPEDLTRGRAIAGTGSITVDGQVGPVGGVGEKVRGAELAGAELFLTPATQVDAAREVASEDLRVVPVETIDDALRVLSGED